MPAPTPVAIRRRALAALQAGASPTDVAGAVQVTPSTVRRWWRRWLTDGTIAAGVAPGRPPRITGEAAQRLDTYIATHPTATLRHLFGWLAEQQGISVSPATMCRTLHRLGWAHRPLRPPPT